MFVDPPCTAVAPSGRGDETSSGSGQRTVEIYPPDIAKRHAQDLILRDKVDFLAGFSLTPEALAAQLNSARIIA